MSSISPSLQYRLSYFHNRGRWLHLNHPRDLSEIWIKYLLDGKPHEYYWLADKYRVRKYVEDRGLMDILTPLIGVWNNPEDIDFDSLPERFALKMNYGAGMNIICTDKHKLDIGLTKAMLKKWMDAPKAYSYTESHYNLIERKIVCEAFVEDGNGRFPTDYKFICIHGKPFCVLACTDRSSDHTKYMPMTLDWQPLPEYNKHGETYNVAKPHNLQQMIEIAGRLADGIDLVRVDLYDTGTRVIFGEMTLTPAGCIFHSWSQKSLDDMGSYYYKSIE